MGTLWSIKAKFINYPLLLAEQRYLQQNSATFKRTNLNDVVTKSKKKQSNQKRKLVSRVTAFLMAPPVKRTILPSQDLLGRRARNGSGQLDELEALLPFYSVYSCCFRCSYRRHCFHLRRQQHPIWIPLTVYDLANL